MQRWNLGGDLAVDLALSDAGELTFALRRGGADLITPSRLGLRAAHEDLSQGLDFLRTSSRNVDESYRTVIGKRREHRYRAEEWTFSFAKGGHHLDVQVRIGRDGVAYRYVVPWTGPVTVCEELSEYVLPPSARAVLLPYDNGRCDYEEIHRHTTVGRAERIRYG